MKKIGVLYSKNRIADFLSFLGTAPQLFHHRSDLIEPVLMILGQLPIHPPSKTYRFGIPQRFATKLNGIAANRTAGFNLWTNGNLSRMMSVNS